MTSRPFAARRAKARSPQTVVWSVSLPHRAWLYHPQLGVLEVETSAPAEQFSVDDVAATRDVPCRWFVGGAVKGLSAMEVRGDAVLEAVNHAAARRGLNPTEIKGYLDVEFFASREKAEGFAARARAQEQEFQRKWAEARSRTVTMRARAWRRRWLGSSVAEEFHVRIMPSIGGSEWSLHPTEPTRTLPHERWSRVTFDGEWTPGTNTEFPVAATVMATGSRRVIPVELWPVDEGDRS